MTPIDLNRLPLWLIIIVLLVTIGFLAYAVTTGRGVSLWGFRIDALRGSEPHPNGPAPSKDIRDAKIKTTESTESLSDSQVLRSATYKTGTRQLHIGRPVQMFGDESATVVLRGIEEKKHKTIYARDELGEFALIEFRGFGGIEASVGVYEESNGKLWLPYFTVGQISAHCAYFFVARSETIFTKASFFWIENINRHAAEAQIRFVSFSADDLWHVE